MTGAEDRDPWLKLYAALADAEKHIKDLRATATKFSSEGFADLANDVQKITNFGESIILIVRSVVPPLSVARRP